MRPSKVYKQNVPTVFEQLMSISYDKWLVITRTMAAGGPSRQKRMLQDLKNMAQLANIKVTTIDPTTDQYLGTQFKIGKPTPNSLKLYS